MGVALIISMVGVARAEPRRFSSAEVGVALRSSLALIISVGVALIISAEGVADLKVLACNSCPAFHE